MLADSRKHKVEAAMVLAYHFCDYVLSIVPDERAHPMYQAVRFAQMRCAHRNLFWEHIPAVKATRSLHAHETHGPYPERWVARCASDPLLRRVWEQVRENRRLAPYNDVEQRHMWNLVEHAVMGVACPDIIIRTTFHMRHSTNPYWNWIVEGTLLDYMATLDRPEVFRLHRRHA
jgi:hypothetical protein